MQSNKQPDLRSIPDLRVEKPRLAAKAIARADKEWDKPELYLKIQLVPRIKHISSRQ
jgi:hypothetical protein